MVVKFSMWFDFEDKFDYNSNASNHIDGYDGKDNVDEA